MYDVFIIIMFEGAHCVDARFKLVMSGLTLCQFKRHSLEMHLRSVIVWNVEKSWLYEDF